LALDQNILGLDVAMQDSMPVDHIDRSRNLLDVSDNTLGFDRGISR
jgi:hypothetical protein